MTLSNRNAALAALVVFAGIAAAQPPADVPAQPPFPTGRTPPTENEFLGMKINAADRHAGITAGWVEATEASWDSRAKGWIPPVKNQGNCGSCWDFSGTFVVEVALIKAGVLKADAHDALSEQYTLSCYENGGCNGDDNTSVLKHAKRVGLPLTRDYGPYRGQETRCSYTDKMKRFAVTDWAFADGDAGYEKVGDTKKIKTAIKNAGGVGCAIAADSAFMNVKPGQVFHGNSRQINHDVALVGWDDAKGAWLLRNSWGQWCDGGYCWIAYGANHVGTEPVYAVVVKDPDPTPDPSPVAGRSLAGLALVVGLFVVGGLVVFFVLRKRAAPPTPPAA